VRKGNDNQSSKRQYFRHFNEEENGAPEEIRTPDPQIRSLVLYPAELRVRVAVPVTGCVAIL
jgi:hypothetical protein